MLEILKNSLRISHNKLDSDIMSNVDACMEDLKRVGVFVPFDADDCSAILKKAIENYVKWQYDFNGKGEDFRKNYERLRDALSLNEDYTEGI